MHKHGAYSWTIVLDLGLLRVAVPRFRCVSCGRTLSFLPDIALPYKHYSSATLSRALQAVFADGLPIAQTLNLGEIMVSRRT